MTKFCINSTIVERLREQDLTIDDLLQECIIKYNKIVIEYESDELTIYHTQGMPKRRIFYINVRHLPNHKVMAYLEKIKNEIKHRDIKC